jgi:hypothetical protein
MSMSVRSVKEEVRLVTQLEFEPLAQQPGPEVIRLAEVRAEIAKVYADSGHRRWNKRAVWFRKCKASGHLTSAMSATSGRSRSSIEGGQINPDGLLWQTLGSPETPSKTGDLHFFHFFL